MNIKQLHDTFEYKDGELIYKIKTAKKTNIGDVAGYFSDRYKTIKINKKNYMAHRLIWSWHNGGIPSGMQIDHIDRNSRNNRIENLRLCTESQNKRNRSKQINNSSGYKGVSLDEQTKKYRAYITHNNKRIDLGRFFTAEEAHKAYISAAINYHQQFACVA